MMRSLLGFVILVPVAMLLAQHQQGSHPAATAPKTDEAGHHACLDAERQAIERGEGFGMALAADRSGYPGPRHVLDLKKELKLTPQQAAGMEKLFAQMKQRAVERGRELLLSEERLEKMFAGGRTADELREETYRIASLRAELRWVHLSTHLAARKVLTPEQVQQYTRMRHGEAGAHPGATR